MGYSFQGLQTLVPHLGGGSLSFEQQMAQLPGLAAYWKLNETSGTAAVNATGDSGLNGIYKNAPSLATTAFPQSTPVVLFSKTNDCVDIFNTDFPTDFDPANGWLMIWFQDSASGASSGRLFFAYADADNQLYLDSFSAFLHYFTMKSGGGNLYFGCASGAGIWHQVALQWGATNKGWFDGVPVVLWGATKNAWVGALTNLTAIGAQSTAGLSSYNGSLGHVALGAGASAVLTDAKVAALYDLVYPTRTDVVACGDSKTDKDPWPMITTGKLSDATGNVWRIPYYGFAAAGHTVAQLHATIDTNAPTAPGNPSIACINIGVNDAASPPAEATWKADLVGCIDGLRAKWPTIQVYISRIWMRAQPANCATVNGWIDDVIATQAYIHAGPDESVWLENGDNGVTYTSDGTHYNAAGNIEAANQWKTALGY